mmetsp:Transcript_86944/g.106629  ORF Transcript_86944/g.106629 Transcript_86944/m.106629 type:complete len:103 (+) Transcript_86944:2-310(+)
MININTSNDLHHLIYNLCDLKRQRNHKKNKYKSSTSLNISSSNNNESTNNNNDNIQLTSSKPDIIGPNCLPYTNIVTSKLKYNNRTLIVTSNDNNEFEGFIY